MIWDKRFIFLSLFSHLYFSNIINSNFDHNLKTANWTTIQSYRPLTKRLTNDQHGLAHSPDLIMPVGHINTIVAVSFNDSESKLASCSRDGAVKLWSPRTGNLLLTVQLPVQGGEINMARFSTDLKRIVFVLELPPRGEDNPIIDSVYVYNLDTRGLLTKFTVSNTEIESLAVNPSADRVAVGYTSNDKPYSQGVSMWSVRAGQLLFHKSDLNMSRVESVAISADNLWIAAGGYEGTVCLWQVHSQYAKIVHIGGEVSAMCFNPISNTLAVGDYGGDDETNDFIHAYDVPGLTDRWRQHFTGDTICQMCYNKAGTKLALADGFYEGGSVRILNAINGDELRKWSGHSDDGILDPSIGHTSMATCLAWANNGSTIVSGGEDRKIILWNVNNSDIAAAERTIIGVGTRLIVSTSVDVNSSIMATLSGAPGNVDPYNTGKDIDNYKKVFLWDLNTGRQLRVIDQPDDETSFVGAGISPDGQVLAVASDLSDNRGNIAIYSVSGNQPVYTFSTPFEHASFTVVSPPIKGRQFVAVGTEDCEVGVYDTGNGKEITHWLPTKSSLAGLFFDNNGDTFAITLDSELNTDYAKADSKHIVHIWNVSQKKRLRDILVAGTVIGLSRNGKTLVCLDLQKNTIKIVNSDTGRTRTISMLNQLPFAATITENCNTIYFAFPNRHVEAWKYDTNLWKYSCSLWSFVDGTWFITDGNNRFDASYDYFEGSYRLTWLFHDDPLTPIAPEMFNRNYYEPRLLARIFAGGLSLEKEVPDLSSLNRVQPVVRIASTKADGVDKDGNPTVSVTVQVDTVKRKLGNGKTYVSGTKDIRLFRDKQVVGACPETKDGGELADVRNDPTLTAAKHPDGTVTYTKVFHGVELPRKSTAKKATFTAYAFNSDGVKSQTSEPVSVALSSLAAASRLGTAYVVSIGMGIYENNAWDLPYAASDADRLNTAVCKALGPDGRQFDHVLGVTLTGTNATREHVKDLLMLLSGKGDKLSAAERDAVDPKHQLAKVHPDDFLFLSFCTHGLTDDAGTYYLLPADTGKGEGLEETPELKKQCITDGDLSYWLRDVDAGRMAMVVDACHAGAVAGLDFKPGPMGSRGMGQLAYDKGMRLLASTQASSVALQVGGDIKSGLLTHALVEDDLLRPASAGKPTTLGEWLGGAVADVPLLYAALPRKVVGVVSLGGTTVIDAKTMGGEPPSLQTPQLFDFIDRLPGQKDIVLMRGNP